MGDNTDKEDLDIPAKIYPELPSDEILPAPDAENIHPNQVTKIMEVHHHPDLHHKPKIWKEYFLEFLMIFLAVTLGFIAENYRERTVAKEKEHHYMESMVQDLKKDTAELNLVILMQKTYLRKMENALLIPVEKLKDISSQNIFYHQFVYFYSFNILFIQHDKTLTQLKSAGGFGVIKNNAVADSIAELSVFYDQIVKFDGGYYDDYGRKMTAIGAQVMKMSALSDLADTLSQNYPPDAEIITQYDRAKLEELYSWIRNVKACLKLYLNDELQYLIRASRLIEFISKEYHLKNE